jgi:hypothetical protein
MLHTFKLSGLAPLQNHVDFNDRSSYESRFLDPPLFQDASLKDVAKTIWVYRAMQLDEPGFQLLRGQLDAGHIVSPFHLTDGDEDLDDSSQAHLIEQMIIQDVIDDPNGEVSTDIDDADVDAMSPFERLAVKHIQVASELGISTSESPEWALTFTLDGFPPPPVPPAHRVLLAMEVDRAESGIKYVPIASRADNAGNPILVHVNRGEMEHVFIDELRFKQAILFSITPIPLPNLPGNKFRYVFSPGERFSAAP